MRIFLVWTIFPILVFFRDIPGLKWALGHPKRIQNGQNDPFLCRICQRASFWSASFSDFRSCRSPIISRISPTMSLLNSVKARQKSGLTFGASIRMFPVSRVFFRTDGEPLSPRRPRDGPKPAFPDFSGYGVTLSRCIDPNVNLFPIFPREFLPRHRHVWS